MAKRIDEDKLKAIISREISDAKLFYRTDIEKGQRRALDYYEGRMTDTPAEEGWSSVVSKDVSDVIGWMLPGIVRVFTASDRIVDYQPREKRDEEFTEQASDTINYDFWVGNPGYRILWDATHDSLLLGDGIVKTWWDDSKKYGETKKLENLSEAQIGLLLKGGNIEILERSDGEPYEEYVDGEPGPDGQPGEPQLVQVPTHNVLARRIKSHGCLRFKCVERGNFFIDRDATTIEESRFSDQRDPRVTRSDLLQMGFDKKKVEAIPRYDGTPDANKDELTRDDSEPGLIDAPDESTEYIELHEIYLKMDVNGDGKAEMIRAYYAGNAGSGTLLEWEEYDDEVPFDQIPCTPVPHRFASDSIAGEVMDIQQIKTVLLRQGLNNTYQVNTPQKDIEEDTVVNMDEIINPTVGGVIIRKTGSEPINYNVVPSILPNVLEAVSAMDRIIEWRTGISRATAALDPEALQNQTATANQNQRDSAYSQIELVARNMSELGWKKVFSKALRVKVKHQDRAQAIRLRGKWEEVNPAYWNADMDAVVNTGLGTGSRDRDLMMLQQVSMQQEKLALAMQQTGMSELAIDMLDKIVKTSVKGAEAAGLRNAADYFPDLTEDVLAGLKQQAKAAAEQPSPEEKAAQAKIDADKEVKIAQAQTAAQKNEHDAQLQAQKDLYDAQLEEKRMNREFALKEWQLGREFQLKEWQIGRELQLKREIAEVQAANKTNESNAKVSSSVHVGGEPG